MHQTVRRYTKAVKSEKGDAEMLEDRVPEDLKMSVSCDEEPEAAGELILTPSPEEEKPESTELILEAEEKTKIEEITFSGESESEARIEEAMKAYDASMDEAAGIKEKR